MFCICSTACVVCCQSLVGKFCLQNTDVLVGLFVGVYRGDSDYDMYGDIPELACGEWWSGEGNQNGIKKTEKPKAVKWRRNYNKNELLWLFVFGVWGNMSRLNLRLRNRKSIVVSYAKTMRRQPRRKKTRDRFQVITHPIFREFMWFQSKGLAITAQWFRRNIRCALNDFNALIEEKWIFKKKISKKLQNICIF